MNFPDYVPDAARRRYRVLLSVCDSQDRRDILERLITRPEMRQVFAVLADIETTEIATSVSASMISVDDAIGERASQFLDAAWCARWDFKKYREQVQAAAVLSKKIGTTAEKLAKLLREVNQKGVDFPFEFTSVRHLLQQAENCDGNDKFHLWRAFRPTLVDGDALVRSAWEKAPSLHYLIDVLAGVALEFKPTGQSETIAAAIDVRQSNKKTEYLRAFASLLLTSWKFPVSNELKHAMATTATVVINDANDDVTYDDVTKQMDQFGPTIVAVTQRER